VSFVEENVFSLFPIYTNGFYCVPLTSALAPIDR
jgi:hypothetical protein